MSGRVVTFWQFRRVAECSVCRALVPKHGVQGHAKWHVGNDEGRAESVGMYRGFKDVTVYDDHEDETGWRTLDTGPR